MPLIAMPTPGMGKRKSSTGSGFRVTGEVSAVMVAWSSSLALKLEGEAERVRSWRVKCSTWGYAMRTMVNAVRGMSKDLRE